MDRRKLIATIVERVGVKLDHDDPAFILVELNHLALEDSAKKVADQIGQAADKFNDVTTRRIDDFVVVANEALSKFVQKTNELKTTIGALQTSPSAQPTVTLETKNIPTKTDKTNQWLWWFVPGAFVAGVTIGALLAFLALR